jgi:hypothetical protein
LLSKLQTNTLLQHKRHTQTNLAHNPVDENSTRRFSYKSRQGQRKIKRTLKERNLFFFSVSLPPLRQNEIGNWCPRIPITFFSVQDTACVPCRAGCKPLAPCQDQQKGMTALRTFVFFSVTLRPSSPPFTRHPHYTRVAY